jgi:hypothetical protein
LTAQRKLSPAGGARVHGASNFLVDPASRADDCPALWRPEDNPSVIVAASSAVCRKELASGLQTGSLVAAAEVGAERHIVLAGKHARHRLVMTPLAARDGYIVPADRSMSVRLAALSAFHEHQRSRQASAARATLTPSPYLRHRLVLLLAILDRVDPHSGEPATVRQIARDLTFRGHDYDRAIEWKSSSGRRQTQRLIAEARRMVATGYRDLLKCSPRHASRTGHCDESHDGPNQE